jgi:carbon-monoxide dehydrogenase medium subunit
MVDFEYLEPSTVEEACALLERYGDEAVPIAGGTAVTLWISQRLLAPRVLVSLDKVPDFG